MTSEKLPGPDFHKGSSLHQEVAEQLEALGVASHFRSRELILPDIAMDAVPSEPKSLADEATYDDYRKWRRERTKLTNWNYAQVMRKGVISTLWTHIPLKPSTFEDYKKGVFSLSAHLDSTTTTKPMMSNGLFQLGTIDRSRVSHGTFDDEEKVQLMSELMRSRGTLVHPDQLRGRDTLHTEQVMTVVFPTLEMLNFALGEGEEAENQIEIKKIIKDYEVIVKGYKFGIEVPPNQYVLPLDFTRSRLSERAKMRELEKDTAIGLGDIPDVSENIHPTGTSENS